MPTLTPRGVQNDPKSHPKRPKSLPKGTQSRPKSTIGGPFGTLEGSLAPLWAQNGSSWAVLGTPWECLGPLRAPLWRLRVTFGSKMVRKSTILTPILKASRGALDRSVGSLWVPNGNSGAVLGTFERSSRSPKIPLCRLWITLAAALDDSW